MFKHSYNLQSISISLIISITNIYLSNTQDKPTLSTPYIDINISKNSTINIGLDVSESSTTAWVKTAIGSYSKIDVNTDWSNKLSYTAQGKNIKVYGNTNILNYSGDNINMIDATKNTNLKQLYCSNNQLTSLKLGSN